MLDFFDTFATRLFTSAFFNRLAWAVAIALVFEVLIRLSAWRLRKAFAPILQRDVYLDATERVKRRKIVLGLPLLMVRSILFCVAIIIIVRYLGFNTQAELIPLLVALLAVTTLIFWRPLKDAAAGYYIMYDNLYAPGERISVGEYSGTVVEVGLRHTRLRTPDGREITLANSEITQVTNHTRVSELEKRAPRT
ncbi:MAG: mechanosensitive ion channel domain-containing protein [Armatimonadia bacterium]